MHTSKNKEIHERLPLQQIAEQTLLKKLAPSSALVNKDGDIFYLHGKTGMYLEPATGEVGNYNILKMAREGLQRELTTALHKAVHSNETVCCIGLRVKTEEKFAPVNVSICKAETNNDDTFSSTLFLVILEEGQSFHEVKEGTLKTDCVQDGIVTSLRQELRAKEEYLQSANEELETSIEELKSSNEEMQSVNEELQSTNEELETSKEELQSVNEELATVNVELQTKVKDLSQVNNDMNNLLAGTGIATVFVDYQLRIMRFTPMASVIINLVKNDIGRPIYHFVNNLIGYESMITDIQSVLDTLIPKEIEVKTVKEIWFTMRILPYRTIDNVIEGAVITFVDITESKKLSDALKKSEKNYRLLFQNIDSVNSLYEIILDTNGRPCDYRYLDVNPAFEKFVGKNACELTGKTVLEVFPQIEPHWIERFEKVATSGIQDHFEQYSIELNSYTDVNIYSPQKNQLAMTTLDISERKKAEEKLQANAMSLTILNAQLNAAQHITQIGSWVHQIDQPNPEWSQEMFEIFGLDPVNGVPPYNEFKKLIHPDQLLLLNNAIEAQISCGENYALELNIIVPDGQDRVIFMQSKKITDPNNQSFFFVGTVQNISAQKEAEKKLKSLLAEKELILKEVNHRIKNNMNTMNSLLQLQAGMICDKTAAAALETAGNRMHSMALLYDKLYQSNSFSDLSINDYLSPLVDEILSNFACKKNITVKKNIDNFILDAKRLQCLGIIINELLTNIMKYAFADRNEGIITVSATLCNSSIFVRVADNGKGIPESVDFENSTGFGLMLVKALVAQLDGSILLERKKGSTFVVEFKQ